MKKKAKKGWILNKGIKKFYNWESFIGECRYYTKNQEKAPYKIIYVGPEYEKISKEIDNEL